MNFIARGIARPVDIAKEVVNGEVSYTFSSVMLTFAAYDEIVASASVPKGKQSAAVERAMHATDYNCKSIPSIQREEVYTGSREHGTAGPVSQSTVLRKVKPAIFRDKSGRIIVMARHQNWTEEDHFNPRRLNPDLLPKPFTSICSLATV